MTARLGLVVIRARDMAVSRIFYESLGLAFREEKHGNGPAHLSSTAAGVVFDIYPRKSDSDSPSAVRIGFTVDSIESVLAIAGSASGAVVTPPKTTQWGRRAVVQDPDGHTVELLEGDHDGGSARRT